MRLAAGLVFSLLIALPVQAQMDFRAEAVSSFEIAERKVEALAEVLTEDQYAWRPAEGVRSIEEALRHVAGTNYWMLTQLGCAIPAETGFTGDYASVVAFEAKSGREETIEVLGASFEHLKRCAAGVADDRLDAPVDLFGTPGTGRGYLMLTSTHLHEHLGQLVTYARVNGVVPPWSS